MKIKKNLLFLVICLTAVLVPGAALAAEIFTSGDYTYSIEKVNLISDDISKYCIKINNNELRIIVVNSSGFKIYTSDGTLVLEKEINYVSKMTTYSNSLFGFIEEQGTFKILATIRFRKNVR